MVRAAATVAAGFVLLVLVLGAGIYSTAVLPSSGTTESSAVIADSAPVGTAPIAPDNGGAASFTGSSNGCTEPDPTNQDGCLTAATAWLYEQLEQHFGHELTSCWDRHPWNPSSDHSKGRACDVTIGKTGTFPNTAEREHGWKVANWLRANATALDIAYVIWDGRIWSVRRDAEGWRTYDGGGIYNVSTPTGGHYDHVHISTRS